MSNAPTGPGTPVKMDGSIKMYGWQMSTGERLVMRRKLDHFFKYHKPAGGNQEKRYELIRATAKELCEVIYLNTPKCADQSAAIRKVREAVFTANAAIALDGEG